MKVRRASCWRRVRRPIRSRSWWNFLSMWLTLRFRPRRDGTIRSSGPGARPMSCSQPDRLPFGEPLGQGWMDGHPAGLVGLDRLLLLSLRAVAVRDDEPPERLERGVVVPPAQGGRLAEAQARQEQEGVASPPVLRDLRRGDDRDELVPGENGRGTPLGISVDLGGEILRVDPCFGCPQGPRFSGSAHQSTGTDLGSSRLYCASPLSNRRAMPPTSGCARLSVTGDGRLG